MELWATASTGPLPGRRAGPPARGGRPERGPCVPGLVIGDQVLEERADPQRDVVAGLPARTRQAVRRQLPFPPGGAIALLDLLVGQALPGAVVHLLEPRVHLHPGAAAAGSRPSPGPGTAGC